MPEKTSSTGNTDVLKDITPIVDYSKEEISFRGRLLTEMMDARNARDRCS
jgi:hypothetical protein